MDLSDLDPSDRYATFARQHLAEAIAVVGKAVPDPALALDIASEAIALAYGADEARNAAASPGARPASGDGATRVVLDAVENVYRATLANDVVPRLERLRRAEPRATTLDARACDGVMRLCREPLPPGSPAAHVADVLRRDQPSAAALRRIRGSGLVPLPPAERERSDEEQGA